MDADEGRDVGASTEGAGVESAARHSASERMAEEDDLREGLAGLSQQLTHRLGLEDVLTRVASFCGEGDPGRGTAPG